MNKQAVLFSQDKKMFHTSDLALLWEIDKPNTLRTTLKRFVDRGILKRIHKGFYSTVDIDKLDPLDLGFAYLNSFAYVSLESILVRNGVIFQELHSIIYVSDRTKSFEVNNKKYKVRQMNPRHLYNTAGIIRVANHYEASIERAVADMLYYNPKYHFDNVRGLDFDSVVKLQKEIGYA
jgi:predicted transcriptional regulator of viral defense system